MDYIACQVPLSDSPGKNTAAGCHAFLQGIFPNQRSNLHLLYWQAGSLPFGGRHNSVHSTQVLCVLMTNLDSVLKSRDITLPTMVCLVKAMVFPVVMYECESWTVKKAEC